MTDLSGQSLGRYHLLEKRGEGGMAIVYKAFDTRLERDVAVKVIRTEMFSPLLLQQILQRFEREAKSLARLSHPNIVKVYDYGEYEGSPYLVLEYQPGGTLKQRLTGQPMPWQDAVGLLLPVVNGLTYAHQHGIIHRDIKPSNILITETGEPMISDFGIARILESEEATALTGTGLGVGTPEYMAPEQWTGAAGPQSDLYSLGVVFYELVTGRKPYLADTPAAILLKQATEPLPRPAQLVPGLPDAVEKILLKTLARNPQDRYAGMDSFAAALDGLPGRQPGAIQPLPMEIPQTIDGDRDTHATIGQQEYDTRATVFEPMTGVELSPSENPQTLKPFARQTVPGRSRSNVLPVLFIGAAVIFLGVGAMALAGMFLAVGSARFHTAIQPASTATLAPLPVNPTATNIIFPTDQPAPTATAVILPTEQPGSPTPDNICDRAEFIADVNIPDGTHFNPGDAFIKTWRVKNVGTCTWYDYSLVFTGGDVMGGTSPTSIATVEPGEVVEINVALTAPTITGTFRGYWRIRNTAGVLIPIQGGYNHESMYVEIKVGQ